MMSIENPEPTFVVKCKTPILLFIYFIHHKNLWHYPITPLTSSPDPRVFTRFISVGRHPTRPIRAAAWLVTARVTVRCDTRRHVSRVTLGAVLTLVTTRHPGIVYFMR